MSLNPSRPPPSRLAPVPVPSPRSPLSPASPATPAAPAAPHSPAPPASPPARPVLAPLHAGNRAAPIGAGHAGRPPVAPGSLGASWGVPAGPAGTPFNTPASRPAAPRLAVAAAVGAAGAAAAPPGRAIPAHAAARTVQRGFDAPTPHNTPGSMERLGSRLQGSLVVQPQPGAPGAGQIAPSYERRFVAGLHDLELGDAPPAGQAAHERAPPSLLASGAAAHLLVGLREAADDDDDESVRSAEGDLGRED